MSRKEREGRRLWREQNPANRPTSLSPRSLNAADVKASCTRAWFKFVPSCGEGTRRYSEIYKGVVLSYPKRRACQHLSDLSWWIRISS